MVHNSRTKRIADRIHVVLPSVANDRWQSGRWWTYQVVPRDLYAPQFHLLFIVAGNAPPVAIAQYPYNDFGQV
jgi:hypothetical protein